MVGGPLIGKSTLARQLLQKFKDDPASLSPVFIPLEQMQSSADFWGILMKGILRDLLDPNGQNPYRKGPDSLAKLMTQLHYFSEKKPERFLRKKLVLLIDDCDRFLPDAAACIAQIENMRMELMAPSIEAICWIGGLSWLDWVDTHEKDFGGPLRRYPLSTVPIRETRSIIQTQLGPEKVAPVWEETGGHPFLLEKYFGGIPNYTLDQWNQRIWSDLRPAEKAVLNRLDPKGKWHILDDLKMEDGTKPSKTLLDRLCMAGVIVRTLEQGIAVLRITSPLIREEGPDG